MAPVGCVGPKSKKRKTSECNEHNGNVESNEILRDEERGNVNISEEDKDGGLILGYSSDDESNSGSEGEEEALESKKSSSENDSCDEWDGDESIEEAAHSEQESDFEDEELSTAHYDEMERENEGANNTGSNPCGFTNAFLERLNKTQDAILQERAKERTPLSVCKYRRSSIGSRNEVGGRRPMATVPWRCVAEEWEATLDVLPTDFFTSKEARLEVRKRVTKGIPAYQGIIITHSNSEDMKSIYNIVWKSKYDLGQRIGTYHQFRIVVGQYARFAVASKMCSANGLCQAGGLFGMMCSLPSVTAFIRYFEIRSAAGTVMNKAWHLIRLGKFAFSYFERNKLPTRKGEVEHVIEYLRGVAKAFKNESRRLASLRKNDESRIGSAMYLCEEDIQHFANTALDEVHDVIESCRDVHIQGREEAVVQFLQKKKQLIQKWSVNFIAVLMLHGGGQRPQVYTVLKTPSRIDLMNMRDEAMSSGVFTLQVSFEKRVRTIDLPKLLVPRAIFRALNFHVNYVLPALYNLHEISEEAPQRNCLLLNTSNGESLDSKQVTTTIQRVLKTFDPELGKVTAMSLRASFATMMIQRHRRGESYANWNEEEFLEYLAKIMNTSTEQLKETYVASDGHTFQACARIVGGLIDSNQKRDDGANENCDMDVFGM